MRVVILKAGDISGLKRKINDEIKYAKEEDIKDIKYSGTGSTSGADDEEYSAMIIYNR